MAVEDPPTVLGPDQAIPAIEEDEDLAEDEVEANPNLFFFLQLILRAIAETERRMAGRGGNGPQEAGEYSPRRKLQCGYNDESCGRGG